MKRFLLVFTAFLTIAAANSQELSREISRTFATGDAEIIAERMDNGVELFLNGQRERLNRQQTVERINRFLETLPWPKFTIVHKSDRSDAGFIIGNLQSDKITYRVNISFGKIDNKEVIQTIRIEQTDD
jgi:hypothetical protein